MFEMIFARKQNSLGATTFLVPCLLCLEGCAFSVDVLQRH